MKKHWILTLCLSWLLTFGLGSGVLAQPVDPDGDEDGDLNANRTDPFYLDPSRGGVYVGGTITYDVLMTGDLDATGFTGTVITIAADGVTFDGNGHKVISPSAGTVISLTGRNDVTVKNVTVAGNLASPGGTGIFLLNSSNNTIDNVTVAGDPATRTGTGFSLANSSNNTINNCDASNRGIGVLMTGVCDNNVISNNRIRNTSNGSFAGYYGAIVVYLATGAAGGNQLTGNDVQGSVVGMSIVGDSKIMLSGNTFGNNPTGVSFVDVSNRTISNLTFPATVENPIRLTRVTNFTLDNVTVAGDPATRTGTGFSLANSSNNTINNCDASNRGIGVLMTGVCDNNVISNNLIRNTSHGSFAGYYGAIVVYLATGAAGGNQLTGNDVQGSFVGMSIVGDSKIMLSGNTFGNNPNGIMFFDVSNRVISNLAFPATVTNPIRLTRVTNFTLDNVTVAGDLASPNGTGIILVSSSNDTITNSDVSNKLVGIQMSSASNSNIVTHNNIFGNGRNISSDQAIELSLNGQGNYWGRSCPGPLFVPGTDSNAPNVVDSFPFGAYDGWLSGGSPGCNVAPVADAGADQTVITATGSAQVTLNGSASSDLHNDPLTYTWCENDNIENCNIIAGPTSSATSQVTLNVGSHAIELTVDDGKGGTDTDEVIITVKSAGDAIDDLIAMVHSLDLRNGGLTTSLIQKLSNAKASLQQGDYQTALDLLNDFVNQVEAQRGKALTEAEADALIAQAQAIIDAINATSAPKIAFESTEITTLPTNYALEQNFPNPFNPSTKIQFSVLDAGVVQLSVYNINGQEVRTLVSGEMNAGQYTINWDGKDNAGKVMPSGIYLYKLLINGFEQTRKMTFMK